MGEIVNLRRERRQRARDVEAQHAAEQRARHGRTRAERDAQAAEAAKLRRATEGAHLQQEDEAR